MTFQTHLKKKRSQYFKKNTKNRKCFYIIRDYLGENKIRAASDKSEKMNPNLKIVKMDKIKHTISI